MAINDVEHCETCEIHEDKIKQVSEHMPDEDELYDLAELFKIFGDSTRIRILYCDDCGFEKPLSEKANINVLKPDEEFIKSYQITVH